ncbi:MAG: carboxypeptidase-like regulatory domain-containing protein, partial [Muribaculaceae bacterium]|nr:carboxypeptidase-like regulatory domain-containing protein [Muribaculaceae bacterium]
TSADNIVLSVKRMSDDRAVYRRLNKLAFNYETRSNLTVNVAVSNTWREATSGMPLTTAAGNEVDHFTENSVELTLRYAPGEKFFQTRTYRIPVNLDAPAITLRHTYAPKGFLGTLYNVNKTEIDISKRWWFSAFGYLDTYIGAGHVWSSSPFINLFTPNVNLSYIIQPRSYALLNPMEFLSTTYASWDFTYWANGALLNFIPYVKNLKLREVFALRGYWGNLNDRCNPTMHNELLQFPAETGLTSLNHGPYMEASVGIENIFKVLRIDYVWRLNYLNVPYHIDRSGLRVAVHITF